MKKLIVFALLFMSVSCNDDDISIVYDIYNEWQWVMTTVDTRGSPITAQELDSTYYYTFTRDGKLIFKNNSKVVIGEFDIIIENGTEFDTYRITDNDIVYGFGIKSDTLVIWQPYSILPAKYIYKITK